MSRIIAIDPGHEGAIVVHDGDNANVIIFDMPTVKTKKSGGKVPDIEAVIKILDDNGVGGEDLVVMEKPQKKPTFMGSSVQANYSAGYYEAMFTVIFRMKKIRLQLVQPKAWQLHFGISTKTSGNTKHASYLAASQRYPSANLKGVNGGIKDGRCDAVLIADYGRVSFFEKRPAAGLYWGGAVILNIGVLLMSYGLK